jgi:gliding motility-associated protein GldL
MGGKFAENCAKLNNSIASQADQSEQLSKNIGAVNAAYQTQLQGINSQIKSTETLVSGLSTISEEIAASVAGVKEYRAQVANLSKTVGELNSIYGNMLSAVTNR